jgi:hypothetical protein
MPDSEEITNLKIELNKQNNKLLASIAEADEDIKNTKKDITKYAQTILDNNLLFSKYSDNIQNKMQQVATKDRMLQISHEKNIYKRKIIYILVSMIVALIISVIFGYTFFSKLVNKF